MCEKIDYMHKLFGRKDNAICWNCVFINWKIDGKGKDRKMGYRWCDLYGDNAKNRDQTSWLLSYPACGAYNDHSKIGIKNLYKDVCKCFEQESLF